MTVHLEVGSNGGGGNVLLVPPRGEHLVKSENDFKGMFVDGMFRDATRDVGDHLGQQAQRSQILDNVTRLGGDEKEVHSILERLVHVADGVGFDKGVLFRMAHEFGEGGEEAFNAETVHFDELARDEGFRASVGEDGGGENYHFLKD